MQHGNFDKNLCFFCLFPSILAAGAPLRPVLYRFGKARGKKKAIAAIVDDIKERAGVAKTVLISHCHNRECAEMLAAAVREKWANAEVRIMPTRGLCSYYAELGGLIVGFRDNV